MRMQAGRHLNQFSLGNKPWWASNTGAQAEKTEKDIASADNRLESPWVFVLLYDNRWALLCVTSYV